MYVLDVCLNEMKGNETKRNETEILATRLDEYCTHHFQLGLILDLYNGGDTSLLSEVSSGLIKLNYYKYLCVINYISKSELHI